VSGGTWAFEHHVGPAADFHARTVPEGTGRSLWWFDVERPAVVLGSTQPEPSVDRPAASAAGIEVARRRSGGGAVWLAPGEVTWVDLVVPAGDPLWSDDVGRATWWLGETWAAVLAQLGVVDLDVHAGPLVRTAWSPLVCFSGLGPGEVTAGGRKVVGISQRRTRSSARFQCAVLHRWDPGPLLSVLALSDDERAAACAALIGPTAPVGLADLGVEITSAELVRAFRAHVPS
jgi:lipoate-protein ligase A